MAGLSGALLGAVSQGVLWGIMVLGVYITFRLLNIADMTVDGSFALGGCVCAALMINHGLNPYLALVVAVGAGIVAGAIVDIVWLMYLSSTGIYEIIPGFIVCTIVAVVVSLLDKKPSAEVEAIFAKATDNSIDD